MFVNRAVGTLRNQIPEPVACKVIDWKVRIGSVSTASDDFEEIFVGFDQMLGEFYAIAVDLTAIDQVQDSEKQYWLVWAFVISSFVPSEVVESFQPVIHIQLFGRCSNKVLRNYY